MTTDNGIDESASKQRLTYSVDESAELLGIGSTLAKELIRTGELRSIKIGRRRLVAHADLTEFVERCRAAA
jgi:excisionase family DNA binding protein